ncbi:MAG: SAM-dependent methyltransferase [Candidatus Wallbacteria bacterium]|nr:SAM-dependent methyltransferase [Candidatus Wallbacteria bacterium]
MAAEILPSSFRDPSGFVFQQDGKLYRQINRCYQNDYDLLIKSGLYDHLVSEELLIPHQDCIINSPQPETLYKIIKPQEIPFISYPYEWCFSQLKAAALLTLQIQARALEHGLTLKDASAYNIQFTGYKPIFIDTLSFEKYQPGSPWIAYRQFCRHFLAPLALMSYQSPELNKLSLSFLDGIPLDVASATLPFSSRFNWHLLVHLHMHASSEKNCQPATNTGNQSQITLNSLKGIIDSLITAVQKLNLPKNKTLWSEYYENTNYNTKAMSEKERIVRETIAQIKPATVCDAGANTGRFSRIASESGAYTISIDSDHETVELNYLDAQTRKDKNLLPINADLSNPTPAIGCLNQERSSLLSRAPADLTLALALIHHLAITNNMPMDKIARLFASFSKNLLIEFIPKTDSQIVEMLSMRKDIFISYNQDAFEKEFSVFFRIVKKWGIFETKRSLYWLERI